jgi:hypothetical protein
VRHGTATASEPNNCHVSGMPWCYDFDMTDRQKVSLWFLAWCLTRQRSTDWATSDADERLALVDSVLSRPPVVSRKLAQLSLSAEVRCPRIECKFNTICGHMTTVTIGGIQSTLHLDQWEQDLIRRTINDSLLDLEIQTLQVRPFRCVRAWACTSRSENFPCTSCR